MPSPITLLTPELSATICQLVEAGNRAEVAAVASGVCQRTYYNWMSKGNKGEEPYCEFFESLQAARAQAEVGAMAVQLAGDTKLGASTAASAQFWLRTSRAKAYAEETRVSVELESQLTKFLDLLERKLPESQYVEILTAWQSEQDSQSPGGGALEQAPGYVKRKLLGTADVVDTEGEPSL